MTIVCAHCEMPLEMCKCNGRQRTEVLGKKARTTAQVNKAVGCDKLVLLKGNGYLYFVYDDPANNIYETESVYTCYLNSMTVAQWAEIGRDFVAKIENLE